MTKLSTSELLYGTDATPGIVAIELSGPDRVAVFQRCGDGTVREEVPFQPWLLAPRPDPWLALRPRPDVERLAGDHVYRYLIRFASWPAFADATRAAREAGERYVDPGSPAEQYLILSGRTLFKGMTFDNLRRLQLDIETTGFDPRQPDHHVIAVALRLSDGREEVLALDESEHTLLERITERIREWDPDVIEGHNLFNFDLPFLVARAARYGIESGLVSSGSRLAPSPSPTLPLTCLAVTSSIPISKSSGMTPPVA